MYTNGGIKKGIILQWNQQLVILEETSNNALSSMRGILLNTGLLIHWLKHPTEDCMAPRIVKELQKQKEKLYMLDGDSVQSV